jgi:hypothetical protein
VGWGVGGRDTLAHVEWYELTVNLVTGLAWPAVVGGIVWGFRSKIKEMVGRTGRLTLPGGLEWQQAEIADREEELQAEVEESAPVLILQGDSDQPPPVVVSDPTHVDGQDDGSRPGAPGKGNARGSWHYDGSATGRSGLVASQRAAFEDVVQRAAEWGAARGRAGLGVEGTKVEWGADGSPRLDIPRVTGGPGLFTSKRQLDRWRALKARGTQLERELEDAERMEDAPRASHALHELSEVQKELSEFITPKKR